MLGFRELTGEKDVVVEAGSLSELVEELSGRYGERFRSAVLEGEEFSRLCVVFVNGKRVVEKPSKVQLGDGDEVVFSTAYGGGVSWLR